MSKIFTDGNRNATPVPSITNQTQSFTIPANAAGTLEMKPGSLFTVSAPPDQGITIGFNTDRDTVPTLGVYLAPGTRFSGGTERTDNVVLHTGVASGASATDLTRVIVY